MDITDIIEAIMSFIGFMSIVATMTPNKNDNKIIAVIQQIINILGANFGKSKNK